MIFWQLHLGLGHSSCYYNLLPSLFKSHHAELDIEEQCLFLHLPFSIKSSALVIYLVKNCDFLRPQLLHFPFTVLTNFLVLGFTFSYTF